MPNGQTESEFLKAQRSYLTRCLSKWAVERWGELGAALWLGEKNLEVVDVEYDDGCPVRCTLRIEAMPEIRTCPWCGEKPEVSEYEYSTGVLFQVCCGTEDCPPIVTGCNTRKQAVDAWNDQKGVDEAVRAATAELHARAAALHERAAR
jgi:hypothetical protein